MRKIEIYAAIILLILNFWAIYISFEIINDLRKEIIKTQIEVLKLKIELNEIELERLKYLEQ